MRRLLVFYRNIKIALKLKLLQRQGLRYGNDFRCMGSVQFGSEPYLVKIGDHVTISFEVAFVTHDGATWVYRETDKKKYTKFAPIIIGNNCFIGCRSTFLPGAKIGDDCIVAAGAVVTKTFPSGVIIGGVPAKIIGETNNFIANAVSNGQTIPGGSKKKKALLDHFMIELS